MDKSKIKCYLVYSFSALFILFGFYILFKFDIKSKYCLQTIYKILFLKTNKLKYLFFYFLILYFFVAGILILLNDCNFLFKVISSSLSFSSFIMFFISIINMIVLNKINFCQSYAKNVDILVAEFFLNYQENQENNLQQIQNGQRINGDNHIQEKYIDASQKIQKIFSFCFIVILLKNCGQNYLKDEENTIIKK